MSELISVVVPVYNVEKFIDKCLTSVIKQTYDNLEILLVDDGSTDNSGYICDQYKSKDKRISVIHKKNGGLSDARNAGIDVAKGEYITFVDSDDSLSIDAIETLYNALKSYNADVSAGKTFLTNKEDVPISDYQIKYEEMDCKTALIHMYYGKGFSTSAWAKLYKIELFKNIRYPVGKFYEDYFTTYKIFLKTKKLVYVDKTVYIYYQRKGSISNSKFSVHQLDLIEAIDVVNYELSKNGCDCSLPLATQTISACMKILALNPDKELSKRYRLWDRIIELRRKVIKDKNCSKRIKGYAILSYLGKRMSLFIYKQYYLRKW